MTTRLFWSAALGAAAACTAIASPAAAQRYGGSGISLSFGTAPSYEYVQPYYDQGAYGYDPRAAWTAQERWEQHERWEQRRRWEQEARQRYWQRQHERQEWYGHRHEHGVDDD